MTKYLNFFESESGFTEAVEAGQLYYPNVSYTENDDSVHWNLAQPANPVETPMLRMSFSTSSPGQEVKLRQGSGITAMEIDGTPVNYVSGGTYGIASPGNHTAVYQFESHAVPEGLFSSTTSAFTAFTSAEITSAVTSIGFQTFSGCRGLTSVTIPDSVTTVGFNAFEHTGLRNVTVPDSVTSMGYNCFMGCTEMQSAIIGSGITAIPDMMFDGCSSLQSVTLPNNLTAIGEQAFNGCSSLYGINIPSGVTAIGKDAFAGCTSLQSVTVPDNITTIGEYAFEDCSGLTEIYFNPQTPPTLGTGALDNTNNCPIYVPAASVEAYQQAWSAYASRIVSKHRITASVNDDSLGRVRLNQETAPEGAQVGFDVEVFEPDANQVTSVTVTDGNGDEVQVTDEGDNSYSFTMPGSDVTISVVIGEKPKHTVTVDSTDDMVTDVDFMSDDGEPSYKEGEYVDFNFSLPGDGQFYAASLQASDCDGNSIEVNLEDEGDGHYYCSFEMPGCDVSVFVTIGEKPKYNISASVNDETLGEVNVEKETAPEGGQVEFNVVVFKPDANQVTSVTVTDGNGDEVECTDEDYGGGTLHYTFTMPASDVTISVVIGEKQ